MHIALNHINLDYLRLMTEGDKDMEQTMLEMLLSELPGEFEKMKSLYSEEKWKELGEVSHKMKSTLDFTGNEIASAANKKIEFFAKNEMQTVEIADHLVIFEKQLPGILQELQQVLKTG